MPEPNPLEKLNWLIHFQHVRGEIVQCKNLIKNEIKRSGGRNEFAYFKQGIILREEGKTQEALESFQTCMKLNPENADAIKQVGKCLYEMRRFRLSLEAYLEAEKVSTCPDWQIYYNIGQCLMRLGETAKSKEYAHKAVQLGKHEAAYSLLIKILTSEGDLRSAISVCNAAIESCPDSVNLLTETGLLCLKLGQTQFAFERLSSALALDPVCAKALLGIGCITQSHDEHDVALTKYKVAVSYEPNSVALWNNIGLCFYSKQKYVAAISCLKRALWISPTNWRVLFNLGLVHLATYQPASAFNFLCAAVNLRPDVPHSFTGLGCALFELNDGENAERAFKQAMALAPDDPVIVVNNVVCLAGMDRKEEAKDLFQKFNSLLQDGVVSKEVVAIAEKLATVFEVDGNDESYKNEESKDVINKSINETDELASGDLSPRELAADEV
ncbi:Bardet-Biedl syndrome 4 protein homolog-like Protein [Tribolium castaneum]|uniref:Bardet-Biedl syndrome 4 protein homolog-like Protein n=2 Tax=Tribolium castaneum TaxID=7070 RepID=D6WTY1_TRICA|nr:Bardet-Biedl syndrome 4 protein homolog-like Protein [Tribolium castaneum]